MFSEQEEACLMLVACTCAQDGLISETEEKAFFNELKNNYPNLDEIIFAFYMDKFFSKNQTIEDYVSRVSDYKLRLLTIKLAEKSATADGLDPKENIALEKIKRFWGF
jgi:hypothetical protein